MLTGQPAAKKIDTVIGQIDVFPTLLDIMGVDYQWHGIGHSVLDSHVLDCAISRDGVAFGKNRSAEQRLRQAWDISDIMIRKGYFKK